MDPVSANAANLVQAIQTLFLRQGGTVEASALAALLGQDVDVLLQALGQDGVKLQLPSGQTVTVQGQLPYPEGTQLRVRVLPAPPGEGGLRLQPLEARPPAPLPLLAPLLQGEAQILMARLVQAEPPAELAPLVQLLAYLMDAPVTPESGASPATPTALPTLAQAQAALRQLPPEVLASLTRALGTGETVTAQDLREVLTTLLKPPAPGSNAPAEPIPTSPERIVQVLVQRFQDLVSQSPEIPAEHRDALDVWIRSLLQRATEAQAPSRPAPQASPRTETPAHPALAEPPASLVPARAQALLQAQSGSKAELPAAWESWIRGTLGTLTDPAASPREAAFHALQAKEGTAFFEIPLPWAQAGSLQIWVESDAAEERKGGRDTTKRVLLGIKFSNLGETRLGLAQGTFGLQVRVWTEHPEALEVERERMEEELADLGKPVDLRIYALTYAADGTIPTLRSLVAGPSLHALG